jgi:hypothetical protein
MIEAVRSSEFFSQIRPWITGINPTLYAIKHNSIDSISSDNDVVNIELNKITEIAYANIKGACEQICRNNSQAILITDGEYWTDGIGERTDLPYLKDSFVNWLARGFVIYIYIENYNESYHGEMYSKKRFYFIFTDDKLQNNIYQYLNKAFSVSPLSPTLKLIKLSDGDIELSGKLTVYPDLESTLVTDRGITAYDIESEWDNMDEYILNAVNADDGTPITGGNYLVRGLKMTSDTISTFRYPELDIRVYNVSESFLNNKIPDLVSSEVSDLFILDKELYRRTGEIGIKLSKDFKKSLSESTENLLRIDIIAGKTNKLLDINDFEWRSLSTNATNISVYQSIFQCINDPKIDPVLSRKVLHSIYLKTHPLYM